MDRFKFWSVNEPESTTYIFGTPNVSVDATTNLEIPVVPDSEEIPDKDAEFTFMSVLLSKCASRYKFAFTYLQQCFTDTATSTSYRIHDIVRLSTSEVDNIYCFQYYDVEKFSVPPTSNSDFEYEPIEEVIQDSNYTFVSKLARRPNGRLSVFQMSRCPSKRHSSTHMLSSLCKLLVMKSSLLKI
jgi:hypothetical protein